MICKKFSVNVKPDGKYNCNCYLATDEKVAAYYHVKNDMFIGRYGEWRDKPLHDVVEWEYAIVRKRHSSDLFPDMIDQLQLSNGLEVFRTEYSCLDINKQERLFNEVELIKAAIMNWMNNCG